MTTTRTASSICACERISIRSRLNPCVMPFSLSGWLNVTVAIPGSWSVTSNPRNVPCCMIGSLAMTEHDGLYAVE